MFAPISRRRPLPTYWELKRQLDRAAREALRPRSTRRDYNRYFALLGQLERGEYRDGDCVGCDGRGY